MIFFQADARLTTDAEFRPGIYEGHRKNRAIIESVIGLDMTNYFPIGDVLSCIQYA